MKRKKQREEKKWVRGRGMEKGHVPAEAVAGH